jgi:hypothetical protein
MHYTTLHCLHVLQIQARRRAKEDAKARTAREYAAVYSKSLGRRVTEARDEAYLRSVTTDGRTVLDPAGTAYRIEPSQVSKMIFNNAVLLYCLTRVVIVSRVCCAQLSRFEVF